MYQKSGGTIHSEVCKGCRYFVERVNTAPKSKFGKMRSVECLLFKAKSGEEHIYWDGDWTACKWYKEGNSDSIVEKEEDGGVSRKKERAKKPVTYRADENGQLSFV